MQKKFSVLESMRRSLTGVVFTALLAIAGCGGGQPGESSTGSRVLRAAISNAAEGGPIINEVNAASWKGKLDDDFEAEDWLEIYNPATAAIDISGYGVSNKAASPFFWVFPAGSWVGPKSHVTVWLSKKDRAVLGAPLHTNFNLDNGGDTVYLTAPNGTAAGVLVDTASPALVKPDQSWCRIPSGSAASPFMVCAQPTFNLPNAGTASPNILNKPTLSTASGFHASAVQVSISGPAGAAIRFTTDGSTPTTTSTLYTSALSIGVTTVVRAAAFASGAESSLVETGTYVIDPALVTKYAGLKAMLVAMPPNDFTRFEANDKLLVSHSSFEMIVGGTSSIFKLDAEGSVAGQSGSLDSPQRAMNVTARDAFGAKAFEAALWPEKPTITSTKKFRLRNGSNDWARAHLRDQLSQSLATGGPNLTGASNSVALFVNGKYYGLMDLREREDETLAANNLGVDKDYVDDIYDPMLNLQEVKSGGPSALTRYKTFFNLATGTDMADEARYEQVKPFFNAESLAWDWAQHLYHGSGDWPDKNVHVWRSAEFDGRWNWHSHDMDFAFGRFSDVSVNMTGAYTYRGSDLIASLLKNAEFRNLYLNVVADQMNLMTPTRMNARLDTVAADMQPYIADHFAKNSMGTEATWLGYVNQIRDYFSARPGFHDAQTRTVFGLKNRGTIGVAVNDSNMGSVKVNTLDTGKLMPAGSPSWSGMYYPGVPITLEARPRPGYAFVGWQGSSASTDKTITHTIPTTTPVNAEGFSARWTGQVLAPSSGTYRLQTVSNDGVRVWLDGTQVINNWNSHSDAIDTSAAIQLEAGTRHDIAVEYFDNTGNATMRLLWQPPNSSTFMPVPATQLYPDAAATRSSGLTAAYFNNQQLTGPAVAAAIEAIDFVWTSGAPSPSAVQFVAVFAPAGTPASPSIQAVPAQSHVTGDIVTLQVMASDPGGFDLKYTASKLPKGINIHPATGRIYGRITTPGSYKSTLTVTNGQSSSSVSVTWTVTDRPVQPGAVSFVSCGLEGASCTLPPGTTADVYFGANSMLFKKPNVSGSVACSSINFGGDPAPNVRKSCFLLVTGQPGNNAPTVSLTPPPNATYEIGAAVTFTAVAADSDGSITRIDFFDGTTSLGSVTSPPYSITWTASAGTHSFTARATDNLNAQTTSAAVPVSVNGGAMVSCAQESGVCRLPSGAVADVYYGANGNYFIKRNITGQISCTNGMFGGDPAPGAVKSCAYVVTSPGNNAPPTVALAAPAANATFIAGASVALAATAIDSDGTIAKVEFFDGAILLGTASASPYTFNWTAAIGMHALTARATDNLGAQTASTVVTVNVNAAGAPAFCANENAVCAIPGGALADVYYGANGSVRVKHNVSGNIACNSATFGGDPAPGVRKSCSYVVTGQSGNAAPTVALTSPAGGATPVAGASLVLAATAADSDGTIAKVEFFDGAVSLGSVATAPYALTWTATLGSHSFTARATDNSGSQTTSAAAGVTVSGQSSTFCANENSTCTLPAGVVADVYLGGNGNFVIKRNVSGSIACTIWAFGSDPAPQMTKSCRYVVTSGGGNAAPTVSLLSPTSNAIYAPGAAVNLSASASDSDGNIAKVEFFDGTTLVGAANAAPYTLNWTATLGAHSFTARATDNLGVQATSSPALVTVNAAGAPTFCANEGATCTLPTGATADVYYGANGNFAIKRNVTVKIACTNAIFGDPAPHVAKSCAFVAIGQSVP